MSERRGHVVTIAVFIGKVEMDVLQDIAKITNTQLLGVDVDRVLENRAAARTKFHELAKKAAKAFLLYVQRIQALKMKTVREFTR